MANGQIKLAKPTSTEIIPLGIPAHKSSSQSNSVIAFTFTLTGDLPDHVDISINAGATNLLTDKILKNNLISGENTWEWDGFDKHGKFSSKNLKQQALEISMIGQYGANALTSKQTFELKHSQQSWVDVEIDKNAKQIAVELRVNIKDGGENGVGELPSKEVSSDPNYAHRPESKIKHQRTRQFAALKMLVSSGTGNYWSRAISLDSGKIYQVSTNVTFATVNAMDDIAVVYNTNRSWLRSSNPGRIRGALSLVGNMIARERIAYNVGFIKAKQGWLLVSSQSADNALKHTAAHELGHEILSAYGGDTYSYTHRGSSSITQSTKSVANGGELFPSVGNEVDLMKYYNGGTASAYYSRGTASNYDVRSLIYLAGLKTK
ncbi:hypothetical protein NBRC116495_28850 [Aurantivibrio plasticivorans]